MIEHEFEIGSEEFNKHCKKCGIGKLDLFVKQLTLFANIYTNNEVNIIVSCISDDEAIIKKIIE